MDVTKGEGAERQTAGSRRSCSQDVNVIQRQTAGVRFRFFSETNVGQGVAIKARLGLIDVHGNDLRRQAAARDYGSIDLRLMFGTLLAFRVS